MTNWKIESPGFYTAHNSETHKSAALLLDFDGAWTTDVIKTTNMAVERVNISTFSKRADAVKWIEKLLK